MENIIFELSVIVVGAALVGTLFLYGKQPIIIAYIAIGILIGPNGLALIRSTERIEQIAHIGVILLLFLIGLNLQPNKLIRLLRKVSWLTLMSSLAFFATSALAAWLLGFNLQGILIFGLAMMFSSTVVGLKLIPTTTLHHRRTGEIMTSVLLLQDILAILCILFLAGEQTDHVLTTFLLLMVKLALMVVLAFLGVKYVMSPLLYRFDVIQEYTFLATLSWCLLWAEIAHLAGLSYELGAFVAGLSIASCQVALVISEHLKSLREFFLILFFFAIGAGLDFGIPHELLIGSIIIGVLLVPFKGLIFRVAFMRVKEGSELSNELAARLSQSSEFSLLLAMVALSGGFLSSDQAMVIQISTLVSIVVSTYWVVSRYPTTIAGKASLRQD
ncbi:MAG: cation:proton antiporter domain-containing protein [bacterium]